MAAERKAIPGMLEKGELLLARGAREDYEFNAALVFGRSNEVAEAIASARLLAAKMNQHPERASNNSRAVTAGELIALGLLHEAYRRIIDHHGLLQLHADSPGLAAKQESGKGDLAVLFVGAFPPAALYPPPVLKRGAKKGGTEIESRLVLREILSLRVSNLNPACADLRELVDDRPLLEVPTYRELLAGFVDGNSKDGSVESQGSNPSLFDILTAPSRLYPDSLYQQLAHIIVHWRHILGDLIPNLNVGLDILKEEQGQHFGGPGLIHFGQWDASEGVQFPERFSEDSDWMSRLVLVAKHTYVWLDQLSRQYQTHIHSLDQIPERELERLRELGVTGLWLIGLWERSRASGRIKKAMGVADGIASAYSIYDYQISSDIGGQDALNVLRERASRHGIRLASDMVPNHMGIDSRWVVEHPERFLGLNESPFPSYSFNGENLSGDDRAGIFLEDHYYDRSDAAVVFLRVDRQSGKNRYIYHGNDGTALPWNDTAQLDYTLMHVREAVIQTIIRVARQFPIIRFDAAMTLAKEHIRRLWFPAPGTGGAIASRAGRGMTQAEFDALVPHEFWREVVDRVASEAPDTLLLAEAFWMMEGYFVRALGMHRVYNSAFMHMLRDERNSEYRDGMKAVLAKYPQVLKRFVNFMNNPDEETAIQQFGSGDKYFGVCTLMATLPGLPMFGHGQFEGLAEKYGMEFSKPRQSEEVDEALVQKHKNVIVPLLQRRGLFAGVENFRLFDCTSGSGDIVENVFAYCNRLGEDRGVVIYNNGGADVQGTIMHSAPFLDLDGQLKIMTLAEALELPADPDAFLIGRDQARGLEYVYPCQSLHTNGMEISLGAYQALVLIDLQVVWDRPDQPFRAIEEKLQGAGAPSLREAMNRLPLDPALKQIRRLVSADAIQTLHGISQTPDVEGNRKAEWLDRIQSTLDAIRRLTGYAGSGEKLAREIGYRLFTLVEYRRWSDQFGVPRLRNFPRGINWVKEGLDDGRKFGVIASMLLLGRIGRCAPHPEFWETTQGWMREWEIDDILASNFRALGMESAEAQSWVEMIVAESGLPNPTDHELESPIWRERLSYWVNDRAVSTALGINDFGGTRWFVQERMDRWVWFQFVLDVLEMIGRAEKEEVALRVGKSYAEYSRLRKAIERAEFSVDRLLESQ